MKKMMSVLMMVSLLVCFAAGCGKKAEETSGSAQLANPIVSCSQEEMTEATGISLEAPEGAEDVSYCYINADDKTAQVEFSIKGTKYCYRAQMTSEILDLSGENIADATKIGEALSGYYEKWDRGGTAEVAYCPAVVSVKNKTVGVITWFDVVPGIVYSLSMEKCNDPDQLISMAELCFVPAQGNS